MYPTRLAFPILVGAALCAGLLRAGGASGQQQALLTALHLHGSISEGFGTMAYHIEQAELAGFDGIWWTDHMGRQETWAFPMKLPLDGTLLGSPLPPPVNDPMVELVPGGTEAAMMSWSFPGQNPVAGSHHLRVRVEGAQAPGSGFKYAGFGFEGNDRGHRSSLLTTPQFAGYVKLRGIQGTAGFLLRVRVSGIPDGVTDEGVARHIEFLPQNFPPPPLRPNTTRIPAPAMQQGQWTYLLANPAQYVNLIPGGSMDMSVIGLELMFYAEGDGRIEIDVDELSLDRLGTTGGAIYQAQAQLLTGMAPTPVFQKVGAEIEGPFSHPQLQLSSRDHMIGLFPGVTPSLFVFPPGSPEALNYPQSGVDMVHAAGGVAILAHLFGARQGEDFVKPGNIANQIAQRVIQADAWGADALEVGYPNRCRPLEDFVRVWDKLSERRVYISGVASSDNHDLGPWSARLNRWGTWILGPDADNLTLIDAVRGGDMFFGDPYRMSADAWFVLEEDGGAFSMGDVVPRFPGFEDFRVAIEGAVVPGSEAVLFVNGVEVDRRAVPASGSLAYTELQWVADGDWVRAELRDSQDRAYAFTNPVYFVAPGTVPPPHRTP